MVIRSLHEGNHAFVNIAIFFLKFWVSITVRKENKSNDKIENDVRVITFRIQQLVIFFHEINVSIFFH